MPTASPWTRDLAGNPPKRLFSEWEGFEPPYAREKRRTARIRHSRSNTPQVLIWGCSASVPLVVVSGDSHPTMNAEIKIEPEQAVEDFLAEKKDEVAFSSWRNYKYPLKQFIEFCDGRDLEYMNEVNGYDLKKFKLQRRATDIKEVTLKNNLSTLRTFIGWCEEAQAVEQGLNELIQLPDLDSEQASNDEFLKLEHIEGLLDHLYKFEYVSMKHVTFQLIWHTCVRMGTLRGFDKDDWIPQSNQLRVRHRPDTESPLKNGEAAERLINVSPETAEIVTDYIGGKRSPGTDNHGRKPLITSNSGSRLSDTTLRKTMYGLTRPCWAGMPCPHDKDPEDCRAANYKKASSQCPSTKSAHPLRRSAITYHSIKSGRRRS